MHVYPNYRSINVTSSKRPYDYLENMLASSLAGSLQSSESIAGPSKTKALSAGVHCCCGWVAAARHTWQSASQADWNDKQHKGHSTLPAPAKLSKASVSSALFAPHPLTLRLESTLIPLWCVFCLCCLQFLVFFVFFSCLFCRLLFVLSTYHCLFCLRFSFCFDSFCLFCPRLTNERMHACMHACTHAQMRA